MIFPNISDIVTKIVYSITSQHTINEAMKLMFDSDHRAVIIVDNKKFYVLATNELIRLKIPSF